MTNHRPVGLEDRGLCYLITTEAPLRKHIFGIEKAMETATLLPKKDEILLDLSKIFIMRMSDIAILKDLEYTATNKYNLSLSLVNPKPNVRCFMKNMKVNEEIGLFDNMEHYRSLRENRYK